MKKIKSQIRKQIFIILMLFTSSCILPSRNFIQQPPIETRYHLWKTKLPPDELNDDLPLLTNTLTLSTEQEPTQVFYPNDDILDVFLHHGLPSRITTFFNVSEFNLVEFPDDAEISVFIGSKPASRHEPSQTTWIYALAAPFYTRIDDIKSTDLTALWRGSLSENLSVSRFYLTNETFNVMIALFGEPAVSSYKIVSTDELNNIALSNQPFLTLFSLEDLKPQWKVIRVDGVSPIDRNFHPDNYPLTVDIWVQGMVDNLDLSLEFTNFDPDKRTILMMTGVTALTRATAHRMETHGNSYPGQDIYDWFSSADFVHISNEVAFAEDCPYPDPLQADLIFCSSPDRIELLEYIGANIIDLTGNHLLDYGQDAINLTLSMYDDRNWATFAGGWNLSDARTPTLINHHGNQLAFLGCNPVGPPVVWATDTRPGSAPCGDYQWLVDEIVSLRAEGYLPIVTIQYFEDYTSYPSTQMKVDFDLLAKAGAVIVSGSQAHTPKSMVFSDDSFVHYGLGNLFFDQMEVTYNGVVMEGTREGFIDRMVFYEGRLMSVDLLTTIIEDYSRPRLMTSQERDTLLHRIFKVALENDE